jgi:hypothetical protein
VNRKSPKIQWLGRDANPWRLPVLDVRPVTLEMVSTSADPACAGNLVSLGQEDGTTFAGVEPQVKRTTKTAMRFRVDRALVDGVLFKPAEMEHKWAIYFHRGEISFVRSWLRQVRVVARVEPHENSITIERITGAFTAPDEEPSFTAAVLDYLLRSHALNLVYPAPLLPTLQGDPEKAALWCFSQFGNRAHFATCDRVRRLVPKQPLRTFSLLHLAAVRADRKKAEAILDAGTPADTLAPDGLTPLHWAMASKSRAVVDLLLQHGSSIEARSPEGVTPLMLAVEQRNSKMVQFLLGAGADPNVVDERGFTALHRAAEMGEVRIARELISHGARRNPEAGGCTPESLARARGQKTMLKLLREP